MIFDSSYKSAAKQLACLAVYLAAGLGATTAATSTTEAAIVNIDASAVPPFGIPIGGVNANLNPGSSISFVFLSAPNGLSIYNLTNMIGLVPDSGLEFAVYGGISSPRNFAFGESIDASAVFTGGTVETLFNFNGTLSPSFTWPNNHIGFRTAQGNYGWLEVAWNPTPQLFEIAWGAYETDPGVAILAGQFGTGTAVPEPGTWAAAALLVGGAAFARWRRPRSS